eukprot:685726-Amphidinium_carterae.1
MGGAAHATRCNVNCCRETLFCDVEQLRRVEPSLVASSQSRIGQHERSTPQRVPSKCGREQTHPVKWIKLNNVELKIEQCTLPPNTYAVS